MPNIDLNNKGKYIKVSDKFKKHFDNDEVSYTNLTTKKNRLENKSDRSNEEEELLRWINSKLKSESNKNLVPKKVRMNIDAEGTKQGVNGRNNFKNRKPNDADNNNVGDIVKLHEEIETIKKLIKYLK